LLNRAARFFPILEVLRHQLPTGGTLLEVGSGSLGLGEFWSRPFVGCDLSFPSPPVKNMRAVQCSGHQLPFADAAFDVVVVSDVMEHVPAELRKPVVGEVLRVARKMVVCGYPCGPDAFALDQKLYRDYQNRNLPPPIWLEEHMRQGFPDENLFSELPAGWVGRVVPNESLQLHYWIMRKEMVRVWNFLFCRALRIMPGLIAWLLQQSNRNPSYRKLFVLTRESEPAYV
jgi:hypothetical protein